MSKKMLIDAGHPEEVRVAVLDARNLLEELDLETTHKRPLKGNIYLAKVTRVEPSLQAAFVEYGGNRHGFLPFGEIHPDYFRIPVDDRRKIEDEIRSTMSVEDDDLDLLPQGKQTRSRRGKAVGSNQPSQVMAGTVSELKVTSPAMLPEAMPMETVATPSGVTLDTSELGQTPIDQGQEGQMPVQFIPEPMESTTPSPRNSRGRVRQVDDGDDEIENIGGEGTEEFQSRRRVPQ